MFLLFRYAIVNIGMRFPGLLMMPLFYSVKNPSLHTKYKSKKLKEKKEKKDKKEKILKPEVLDKAAAEYKGKLREAEVGTVSYIRRC